MKFNKKTFLVFLLVFALSFLWMFSLTYNINYYWEDGYYIQVYQDNLQNPERYNPSELVVNFFKILIEPDIFYQSGYGERPLLFKHLNVIIPVHKAISKVLFGTDTLNFFIDRMLKSLLFACFVALIFCFLYRIGKQDSNNKKCSFFQKIIKDNRLIMSFLLLGYVLVIPEIWLLVLYFIDELLLNLILATIPLALFFFYYNDDSLKNKVLLGILFILIAFITYVSNLIKHVGRINFLLIFMFLLFTNRKKIITWRYGSLILVLFFLSFPLLGMSKIFYGESPLDIVGISDHMGLEQGSDIFSTFFEFLATFHLSFLPHTFFLLLLFFLFFILQLHNHLKKKKYKETPHTLFLKKLVFFSFFWYLFTAIGFFIGRGFVFPPKHHLRLEFSIFLVPQALFLVSYAQFVYKKYFSAKKFMQYLIYALIILAMFHNVGRLNQWRGGWGAYFLGYDTARQYIDDYAEDSIMLVRFDHSLPTYFVSTNKIDMVSNRADLVNSSLIKLYQKNYTTVFIVDTDPIAFDDPSVVNVSRFEIIDHSPYGKFKKIIGRYYPKPIYLYTLQKE